ncbi:hypothetical protein CDAR_194711 [Caerostris darwini]|uniref:Uncharacterized protein n=1 Tax=Caerostris darwini TaxID=1538125 RepID=A0AAV4X6Z9_9ARAC|nr:hypothetical protein CDAR_194711 [Caerostris darwini]
MWESLAMREPMLCKARGRIQPAGISTDTRDRMQSYHYSHRKLHQQKPQGLERQQEVVFTRAHIPRHPSHDSALQLAVTTCRHTSTASV